MKKALISIASAFLITGSTNMDRATPGSAGSDGYGTTSAVTGNPDEVGGRLGGSGIGVNGNSQAGGLGAGAPSGLSAGTGSRPVAR